jgi:hypothetical protein
VVAPEYAQREAHPPPVPEQGFVAREESIWDRDPDLDDFYAMDVMYPEPVFVPEPELPLRVAPPAPRRRSNRLVPAVVVAVVALVAGWVIGSYFQQMLPPFTLAAVMPRAHDAPPATNDERLRQARERVAAVAAELAAAAPPVPATAIEPVPVPLLEPVAPALAPTAVRASSVGATRDASGFDLSGWWALTTRVDAEAAGAVDSLNLGFHLQLQQRGHRVSGTGERWMENGRSVPSGSRTQIEIDGTLIGRRLELNFTESGRQPATGKFVMNVTDAATWRGRFVSAGAAARGMSLARRMEPPR